MAEIKKKGFNMVGTEDYQIPNQANNFIPIDFSKIVWYNNQAVKNSIVF